MTERVDLRENEREREYNEERMKERGMKRE